MQINKFHQYSLVKCFQTVCQRAKHAFGLTKQLLTAYKVQNYKLWYKPAFEMMLGELTFPAGFPDKKQLLQSLL